MFEIAVCHAVANALSGYNTMVGDWKKRHEPQRLEAQRAWVQCRRWLFNQGLLIYFMRAGNYMVGVIHSEIAAIEREIAEEATCS